MTAHIKFRPVRTLQTERSQFRSLPRQSRARRWQSFIRAPPGLPRAGLATMRIVEKPWHEIRAPATRGRAVLEAFTPLHKRPAHQEKQDRNRDENRIQHVSPTLIFVNQNSGSLTIIGQFARQCLFTPPAEAWHAAAVGAKLRRVAHTLIEYTEAHKKVVKEGSGMSMPKRPNYWREEPETF